LYQDRIGSYLPMVAVAVNYCRFFAHRQLTAAGAFESFCGVFQPSMMCQQQFPSSSIPSSFLFRIVATTGNGTVASFFGDQGYLISF